MADTYLNKKGAQHRAEKTKEWADARFVRYTTYNAVGVAGSGKNVSVLFPQTLFVPDGLIMGGSAQSAGLVTRGICGVTTPDGKGGCTKENLYLNYDGNNNYSRKVVLGAGSAGNEIANSSGAYTFSAVRGDQMVSYVTNYVPGAIKTWFDSNVHIPSIKTLNTNNSSTLPVSSSEERSGSGSINLHKVAKTGKFSDLNNRGEAFLSWGGQNFAGSYGPIDSAMIPDLGANRLAFMPPAGISVEYSRDSGTTWQDYGATDGQKLALTSTGVGFNIGKSDSSNKATEKYMLRISLHTSDGKVYTQLNKFALYVSTNGSSGSYCTIRARTQNNYLNKVEKWDVFANKQSIAGWSGWNIINTSTITTYGNSPANQYGEIQLIFGCTAGSTTYAGLQIQRLMGFGGVGWTTPSNRAKYGTIYSYDYNQNAIFPKDIYVQSGSTKEEDRYKVLVTGKTNTFTGTHAFNSGKIYLGQGDPNAIDLGSDGRINSGNSTLVGFVNKAFTLGHSSYETNIRGSGTRPKYNGNALARIIDLPVNYVSTNTAQTITGTKTFDAPANENGVELATTTFKTSNGGQLIIGKEGPNSGTMLRFDQVAGTPRLYFRASATPGAMVWSQPEKGATLYFDLTNSAGVSTRTTLDARNGTIARTSDIGNGTITIQKNGTKVDSFTTNQSSGKTINIPIAKSDVGLGNVDNTADKDKSVKYASSAGTATNLKDSDHSYTATDNYNYLHFKEQKIAYRAIAQQCEFAMALAELTRRQHKNYGSSLYDKLYHQPGYVQVDAVLDDNSDPLPNKFSNPSIGGYSEITALTLDISDMIPASSEVYPPNPYMFFLLKHITDANGNSGFYGSSPIVSGPRGASGNDTVTFNVDLWFPDSKRESKTGTATITCNATTGNIAGVYATKDELTDGLETKANASHTHSISQITNLQTTLNGKQATLVSGTNIKTVNGNSILGSGDLSVSASLDEKSMADIRNATSSKSSYIVIGKLLIQWGVYIGAHGDTTNWEVTYPKSFYWYPAVILQTKDTNTNSQGLPYSNGAVITSYRNGESFTFQLRRSETCPVYWIAIGGLR